MNKHSLIRTALAVLAALGVSVASAQPPKKPDPMIGKLLEPAFTPAPKAARS